MVQLNRNEDGPFLGHWQTKGGTEEVFRISFLSLFELFIGNRGFEIQAQQSLKAC
jgi:hypothetical protein